MKNIWKIAIIIFAICGILFVTYSSFIVIQENNDLLTYGDDYNNYSTNHSIKLEEDVSLSKDLNISKGNYTLSIDCDAEWYLNCSINGKNYQENGNGSKNISLGNIYTNSSFDFNQIKNGSTCLDIYNSNKFIGSVYQKGKTVKIHYDLNVN